MIMKELGLLFDAKQFACVFRAATRDVAETRVDARVWLADGAGSSEVGIARRHGRITYQGRTYALIHSGLSMDGGEGTSTVASGIVMRLGRLSDFNGIYVASGGGAMEPWRTSASCFKNNQGVVIKLIAADGPSNFSLSHRGWRIKIEDRK
jgi:hypothetical protein